MKQFSWSTQFGYEVSTRGDRRFSAFCALLADGRSIEQHYQCDVKGYDVGGTNWKLGKGKPSLNSNDLLREYVLLWKSWVSLGNNIQLMRELYTAAKKDQYRYVLRDSFAKTPVNQANALALILNELCSGSFKKTYSTSTQKPTKI